MKKIKDLITNYSRLTLLVSTALISALLTAANYDSTATFVLALTLLITAGILAWEAIRNFQSGNLDADIIGLGALTTAFVLDLYWVGVAIAFITIIRPVVIDKLIKRSKNHLESLLPQIPKHALQIKGKKQTDIAVGSIKKGDKLLIGSGQVIPVDCQIISGQSTVDISTFLNQEIIINRHPGEVLLSGMTNYGDELTVQALRNATSSHLAILKRRVRSVFNADSPFIKLAARINLLFAAAIYIIAASLWVISGESVRFLEVIIVASPFVLIGAIPLAIKLGIKQIILDGNILSNGASFERLAEIESIAFNKSGVLTEGNPLVKNIKTFKGFNKQTVLSDAAAIAQSSSHILARAITARVGSEKIRFPKAKRVTEHAGQGLVGIVQGRSVVIGTLRLMAEYGIDVVAAKKQLPNSTVAYVAINGTLAGMISFDDDVRTDAKPAIKLLKKLGIKNLAILSGDSQLATANTAKLLSIKDVYAECGLADKMRIVETFEHKPVAFVGNPETDAPVFTHADATIALGGENLENSIQIADVIVLQDNLLDVAEIISSAKHTLKTTRILLLLGILTSLGLIAIFGVLQLNVYYALAVRALFDILVLFIVLRTVGRTAKSDRRKVKVRTAAS